METVCRHNFVLVLTLFSLFAKNMVGEAVTAAPPCPDVAGPKGEKGEAGVSDTCDASLCPAVDVEPKTNYVRFGRKACPSGAELVYEGLVGGSSYAKGGGGSNYLCMPLEVSYEAVSATSDINRALIYSTTYAHGGADPLGLSAHTQTLVPCAFCLVRSRSRSVMIPATKDCPSGWTEEYSGYLMAEWSGEILGDFTRHSTEYVCVDIDAENVESLSPNYDSVMYMTEMFCDNGLPCGAGQYVANNELACVVCTI